MSGFRLWSKYMVLFRAEWSVMVAYRSEQLIWMFGAFVQPLVSMAVWLSISGEGQVGGYTFTDYVRYFLGVLLVERLTRSWVLWELDSDIREGSLSAKLLRPFHPIHWSITQDIVYKISFAMILIPAWVILAILFPTFRLPVTPGILVLAALAILLASMIRFMNSYMFGLLGFWTNKATSIYMLYEGIHLFLAGRIAPLSLFPEWISKLAWWLPFYSTVGFPVELLTGKLTGQPIHIAQGLLMQVLWATVLMVVLRQEWRAGIKKYGAVGG